MNVLAVNCGSSTLKFALFEATNGELTRISHGKREVPSGGHAVAAKAMLDELRAAGRPIDAVGHRVVHGGERFRTAVRVDDAVLGDIRAMSELAPLHNGPALDAMAAIREGLGSEVPMVACFDTAFHRTMPDRASHYAIDVALARKHGVYRYGFHGLAHRSMTERYAALSGKPAAEARLITVQLGAGCSIAAIDRGRSIDTSMGFTPLEGMVMATRSGDIDPAAVGYIARREGVLEAEVLGWLNTRSGLLGLSGVSADMRELLEIERRDDERAALAIDMFCYRVRKYIGAYVAALGGADAVVFGGGIGERSPEVRSRICAELQWLGLTLEEGRNEAGEEGRISAGNSRVAAYIARVDEERIVAADTIAILTGRPEA